MTLHALLIEDHDGHAKIVADELRGIAHVQRTAHADEALLALRYVVPDVLTLLEEVVSQTGPVPVVLERDQSIPALPALLDELARVRAAYDRGIDAHGRRSERSLRRPESRAEVDPREAAR